MRKARLFPNLRNLFLIILVSHFFLGVVLFPFLWGSPPNHAYVSPEMERPRTEQIASGYCKEHASVGTGQSTIERDGPGSFYVSRGGDVNKTDTAGRAGSGPNATITLSADHIFRGGNVTVVVYVDGSDPGSSTCTITYSRDNANWFSLPTRRASDHFEATFETSHSSPAGTVSFTGIIRHTDTGYEEYTGIASLAVGNNPPIPFGHVDPLVCVTGEIITLSGAGSFDVDGSIDLFCWSMNGVEAVSSATTDISYRIPSSLSGSVAVTLSVTDDEGATSLSGPMGITVIRNQISAGDIHICENGEQRKLEEDKCHGTVSLAGNFTDLLGFEYIRFRLRTDAKIVIEAEGNASGNDTGYLHVRKVPSNGNMLTRWSYDLDTCSLADGDYTIEVTAVAGTENATVRGTIQVRNSKTNGETHTLVFLLIGSGILICACMICVFASVRSKKALRERLLSAGHEPIMITTHIPLPSVIVLGSAGGIILFVLISTSILAEGWPSGLVLLFFCALTGVPVFLACTGRSSAASVLGAALSLVSGSLHLWLLYRHIAFALIDFALLSLLAAAVLVIHILVNRHHLFFLHNRVENTTSAGTNLSLNAFHIHRDRGADAPGAKHFLRFLKKGSTNSEGLKSKCWKVRIFGKISYVRLNSGEVVIGVFDIEKWDRDRRIAGIMFDHFLQMMRKKKYDATYATAVTLKLLSGDPAASCKRKLAVKRRFKRIDGDESGLDEEYRLDIDR